MELTSPTDVPVWHCIPYQRLIHKHIHGFISVVDHRMGGIELVHVLVMQLALLVDINLTMQYRFFGIQYILFLNMQVIY